MCRLTNKSATPLTFFATNTAQQATSNQTSPAKTYLDAITKAQQKLKLFKDPGEKGIVIFTGALPQPGGGPGTERMEAYVIVPPEPIRIFLYRCDSRFHTEHLQEMLREKETYGILLVDANNATVATLQGKRPGHCYANAFRCHRQNQSRWSISKTL
jgi:peptide chain release factor subunit 1